jgi:hypothetical protein
MTLNVIMYLHYELGINESCCLKIYLYILIHNIHHICMLYEAMERSPVDESANRCSPTQTHLPCVKSK